MKTQSLRLFAPSKNRLPFYRLMTPLLAGRLPALMLIIGLMLLGGMAWGQAAGDYRSNGTGNWSTLGTWQRYNGSMWIAPTMAQGTPTSASGAITIRSLHTVTVTANVTVDQVTVEAGGEVALPGSTFTIANGAGDDFVVDGTLSRTGGTLTQNAGSTLVFNSGGTYIHGLNGGTVPTATWNANSNCNITGMTTTYPSGMGQTFGNVAFSSPLGGTVEMSSNLTCAGNLTISNSGGSLRLTNGATSRTITVGGNLTHTTGEFRQSNGAGTGNITVTGNFIKSGAGLYRIASSAASSSLTVGGSVTISTGTFEMTDDSGNGTLNVAGNFTHTGGTITETAGGVGNIVFNGPGTPQTYTSGGTVSNTINFTVNSGAFLQMAAAGTTVTGGGLFTLSSGATLGITSPQGITTAACGTGGTCGNIRTTTRTFNTGANYVYNGPGPQNTGNGLPSTVNDLTFDNPGWAVTFNAARSINNFSITTATVADLGTFTHAATTLTLGGAGAVSGSWGHTNSPATNKNDVFFGNNTGIVNVSISLPIELLSFTGKIVGATAVLDWRTATETNNDYMAVERMGESDTGRQQWTELGRVPGAGTTTVPQAYSFIDYKPLPGTNYYRLRQVDYDGTAAYHNVIALEFAPSSGLTPRLFPNPVRATLTLSLGAPAAQDREVLLLDVTGRMLQRIVVAQGSPQAEFQVAGLPAGVYFVRVEGAAEALRFVKE